MESRLCIGVHSKKRCTENLKEWGKLIATKRWRSSKATKQTPTRRCKAFKCCKMLLEDEGDKTRPRECKYPTPPCALAKILPETTVRAYFRQIETASPTTNTFLTFSTIILCPCMYTPGDS